VSERLEVRAEVLKIARLLDVDEAELGYLADVPAVDLRDFRAKATDRLFTSAPGLARAAAVAKLIPSKLVASIAQRAFGPVLCARAAGGADPGKAVDVAKHLPPDFLADVAVHLDPRRVATIIAGVPMELVVPVAEELERRGEFVTMGRFLAFVPDHAIAAAIGALTDEAMLRTAFVLEHKDRLDHAIGLLPPERLPEIIHTASRLDLWSEALELLHYVSDERKGPIADLLAELPSTVVAELVAAVSADDLWSSLLPVVRVMQPEARVAVAGRSAFHTSAVLADILDSAIADDLWLDLVPLVDALPPEALTLVAGAVAELPSERLVGLVSEATAAPETMDTLLRIVTELDPAARRPVVEAIDAADQRLAEALLVGLGDVEKMADLVPLVPDDLMQAIERSAHRLGLDDELRRVRSLAGEPRRPLTS
jgi:hypothetical protein